MKLCDVAQSYHAKGGGIKTYIDAKRAAALDAGVEHVLIVPGERDSIARLTGQTVYTLRSPQIPGCAPYRLHARALRLLALLQAERPDIIEIDSPYLTPWVAFEHRRRRGGAVVAFQHTDVAGAYVAPLARRWLGERAADITRRAADRYLHAVHRRCDLVLTASEQCARQLASLGPTRRAALRLGVDTEAFHPLRRSLLIRRRLGVEADAPLLIYAGRLDAEKRPDLIAAAFTLLPTDLRAHLVMVGNGPLGRWLEAFAAAHPTVHVLPYQTERDRLAALFASADLYVSAAPHETFGLSVLEAQAAGLPVVGVRAGAMIDRVPPALGRLAEPGSAASLAEAIVGLWREGARPFGRRARRLVETSFSWRQTFERLFPLYQDVLAHAAFR